MMTLGVTGGIGSGKTAVVANLDSPFVTVIDLASATTTNVTTSTRNSEVVISPDGQYAYVSVVTSDGVWRVDLNALATSGGKLPAGSADRFGPIFERAVESWPREPGAGWIPATTTARPARRAPRACDRAVTRYRTPNRYTLTCR